MYIYIYMYILCISYLTLINFVKLSTLLIETGSHKYICYSHCSSGSLSPLVLQDLHLI